MGMAGALLGYVENTQRSALNHIAAFRCRESADAMVVDRASLRNLEVEVSADGSRRGSLVSILDDISRATAHHQSAAVEQ